MIKTHVMDIDIRTTPIIIRKTTIRVHYITKTMSNLTLISII